MASASDAPHSPDRVRPLADVTHTRFGSETDGLLCGYLFADGERAMAIDSGDALALMDSAELELDGRFLWLHFNLSNQASHRWLHKLQLSEAFYEALEHGHSTRVELADGSIVAMLNDVTVFGADALTPSAMTLCVNRQLMISARETPLRAARLLREAIQAGDRFRSSVDLLARLLHLQADVLAHVVHDTAERIDRVEDTLLSRQVTASRTTLGATRRMLVRLHRLLAPEPSALFRLINRPPPWVTTDDIGELRSAAEELTASIADCTALVERIRLLQEEAMAIVNEQTGRTLFVLTVVTVLALPLTIITGLLGMNVGGVPLRDSSGGFWTVVVILAALTACLATMVFRRRPPA